MFGSYYNPYSCGLPLPSHPGSGAGMGAPGYRYAYGSNVFDEQPVKEEPPFPNTYFDGLPASFASKADAELVVGSHRFPIHTQIVSMKSPVLAALLDGAPAEAAAGKGQLPVFLFSSPEHEAGDPKHWDTDKRPVLDPRTVHAFLQCCYGQPLSLDGELGWQVKPRLERLLKLAQLLGSTQFSAALDAEVQSRLLEGDINVPAAAEMAMKYRLEKSMAALLPLIAIQELPYKSSYRKPPSEDDCLDAFKCLDEKLKLVAFSTARTTKAELEEEGVYSLQDAVLKCEKHLAEAGWGTAEADDEGQEEEASQQEAAGKQSGSPATAAKEPGPVDESDQAVEGQLGAGLEQAQGKEGADGAEDGLQQQADSPAVLAPEQLARTPYRELQQQAKQLGLRASGKAQDLIDRILEAQQNQSL